MCSNIILGGAQLGLNYGITNCTEYVGQKNSHDILLYAQKLGITAVDIAYDYGQIFGWINSINPGLALISKLKLFNQMEIRYVLKKHLSIDRLKYLLIHDADDYCCTKTDKERVHELIEFCITNGFKWGISVYSKETVRKFLDQGWVPDLVQYPHNVLCADDEIGNLCSSLDIETHIRSVLLQGLLILPRFGDLPSQFRNNASLMRWYEWLAKNNFHPIDVCLRGESVAHRTKILGVQNVNQLEDLIGRALGPIVDCTSLTKSVDKNLLDPRNWIDRS